MRKKRSVAAAVSVMSIHWRTGNGKTKDISVFDPGSGQFKYFSHTKFSYLYMKTSISLLYGSALESSEI